MGERNGKRGAGELDEGREVFVSVHGLSLCAPTALPAVLVVRASGGGGEPEDEVRKEKKGLLPAGKGVDSKPEGV